MKEASDTVSVDVSNESKIRALPWSLASGVLVGFFSLWTFGGSVFVLFLNELGLPAARIGFVLSIFPFCGLLGLGFAPLAARLGWKRVLLACYGARKPVMALLLLLPWVERHGGHGAAFVFLVGVLIVFAVLRALAETAAYPWAQQYVPNHVRGRYAAWSSVLGLVASGAALAVAGKVLALETGLRGYLWLIGAGSALGFVGVLLMIKVPGGAPLAPLAQGASHAANLMQALRDRNLRAYLGGVAGLTLGGAMLTSFLPLYVRGQLGLPAATVVRLDIAAMAGGALASLGWGWLSDRVGSRPVLMPAATLMLVPPLAWLWLPSHAPNMAAWCAVIYLLSGVAANGVAIGAGRLLYNSVAPSEKSAAYMSIYYAWIGVTGGVAPLLAGGMLTVFRDGALRSLGVDGYKAMFVTALLFLMAGALLYKRVRPDDRHTTRTALRSFLYRINAEVMKWNRRRNQHDDGIGNRLAPARRRRGDRN